MYRFNPPPDWPELPSDSWQPPPGWEPDPAWPDAPDDWGFWVGRAGRPAVGPFGAFGSVDAGRLELATADPSLVLMHA
ncbi:hypothetical protein [Kribbella antibiotica]|uniref:hypothetical protein n=1 Tax=Kribbella antibiotica TaxID=190195 RepID=UPI00192D5408|nr:hypothetical protein [Kribbella antibiotica]